MKKIPLRRDGKVIAYALVDDADFEWLTQWRWQLSHKGYAVRASRAVGSIRMHREILGLTKGDGFQGDHRNGNRLDNRRRNLRVGTMSMNAQNRVGANRNGTSGYRGVSWYSLYGKWRAQAVVNGKHKHIGYFENKEDAAEAAKRFRLEHMEFANG